jgi:hypothetical protein
MGRRLRVAVALAGAAAALGCVAGPAYAGVPAWAISSASSPTNFSAGDETGDDRYVLTVVDTGGGLTAAGSPIEVTDLLPSGLTASAISGEDLGNGQALTCGLTPLECTYEGFEVAPGDVLRIEIRVKVSSGVTSSVVNRAAVTGGDAEAGASSEDPTTISSTGAGFGVSDFAATWSGTQAGAAVNLTTGLTFNQVVTGGGETVPAADAKEVALNLPPGFVANPTAVPRCSVSEVEGDACPASSAVGVAFTSSSSGVGGAPMPYSSLVYNTAPSPGEPGALVLFLPSGLVWLELTLRTNGDYGLRVAANDLPEVGALISLTLTLWGDPGADEGFGSGPDHVIADGAPSFGSPGGSAARFLTSAGTCGGALPASTLSADSWAAPAVFAEASSTTAPLTGCNRLPFDPSLSIAADVIEADTPSGYEVDLNVPQPQDPEGFASADLKQAAVTLPEGVGISLSAADGLQACTQAQVGLGSTGAVTCPEAAKVGTVAISTPLLANPLQGAVYLAAPKENPFGSSTLAVYIVAEDPVSGVQLKLAAQLEPNPVTGQLTIVLRELPQLSISNLELHFFGGERALLSTPPTCGLATSTSELTPWSGSAAVTTSSAFDIAQGLNGASCSASSPFSPTFQAGSTGTGESDVYGSLSLLVSRTAQEQQLGAIVIQAPPAVAQMFAGVPACGEPQASEGACPQASEVGTVAAQAGLGSYPADLHGEIYLTGPTLPEGLDQSGGTHSGGAAQGLEIVLPVEPGPLELGNVVMRASAQIEPGTGRLSIATGPLPSFADGAPLQFKTLLLQLDRKELRISPDGCESLMVTGTISSTQGGSVTIANEPFGAASSPCPPQAAPAPAATPEAGTGIGGVSLAGTRIATTRGEAAVKLTCTGTGTCRGRVTLTVTVRGRRKRNGRRASKTETIGTASFSIPAGRTATIKLKLNATSKALLSAAHGRLSASLTVLKSAPAPSQKHSENVQLVQQKARGKTKK